MSHAEKCPVCLGGGKVGESVCHGCGGKGWVIVPDDAAPAPVWIYPPPYPQLPSPWQPAYPGWPIVTYQTTVGASTGNFCPPPCSGGHTS